MARHTALLPASALRRVVRARLGGLLPVTAPTPQYHNLERWPAAALSLNYHEGAAMLPSEAATPGLRSQALARDRLSITGLYAVAPPRREESLSLIPYAACRLPSAVHLSPRLQRGVQPRQPRQLRWLCRREFASPNEICTTVIRVHSLKLSGWPPKVLLLL
jgi:hypothetical protein